MPPSGKRSNTATTNAKSSTASPKRLGCKLLASSKVDEADIHDDCIVGKWSVDFYRVHAEILAFLKQHV